MVFIANCPHCKTRLLNRRICSECQVVELEEILAQIKKELKTGKGKDLSGELKKKVLISNWRTMKEHLEAKRKKRIEELDEESRRVIKQLHLEECSKDYDKKHGGPRF